MLKFDIANLAQRSLRLTKINMTLNFQRYPTAYTNMTYAVKMTYAVMIQEKERVYACRMSTLYYGVSSSPALT